MIAWEWHLDSVIERNHQTSAGAKTELVELRELLQIPKELSHITPAPFVLFWLPKSDRHKPVNFNKPVISVPDSFNTSIEQVQASKIVKLDDGGVIILIGVHGRKHVWCTPHPYSLCSEPFCLDLYRLDLKRRRRCWIGLVSMPLWNNPVWTS